MSFGEKFEGMSEREILIEFYTDASGRLEILEDAVGKVVCPSPKCAEHADRLNGLEDRMKAQEKIEKRRVLRNMTLRESVLAIVCAILGGGLAVEFLRNLIGGT